MSTELTNPTPEPTAPPAEPVDPQAKIAALLERISEQNATLIIAAQAQTRLLSGGNAKAPSAARVKVVDFDIPFWALVGFMLKVSIATIPAGLIIGFFWFMLSSILTGIFLAASR